MIVTICDYLLVVIPKEKSYKRAMRVIGIDPGLQIVGYAVVEMDGDKPRLIEAGCIRTKQKESTEKKLLVISKEIGEIIAELNPNVMAVEDLYSHYNHPKTAIIMGHARGVILLKAAEANLKVHIYASTRVKNSLTGNGRAPKSQMQMMIANHPILPMLWR